METQEQRQRRYEAEEQLKLHHVKSAADMPKQKHWAILIFSSRSIYHEGDERSRTNPGHGYAAYTETVDSAAYHAFFDRDVWEAVVKALYQADMHRKDMVAFETGSPIEPKLQIVF